MRKCLQGFTGLLSIVFLLFLFPELKAEPPGSVLEINANASLEGASAYPNPFKERLTIEYQLKEDERVVIQVNNILGQKIRTLKKEDQQAGLKRIIWDGTDESGSLVGTGMYYITLRTATQKMVIKVMKTK